MARASLLSNGQIAVREMLLLAANTGTNATPVWALVGKRVESSDMEYDYSAETAQDILGNTYTDIKKPIITQTFDAIPMIGGEEFLEKVYENTRNQDISAMGQYDLLVIHTHYGESGTPDSYDAERYEGCAVLLTSAGGEGGGYLQGSLEVTFGGERTLGAATISGGTITFS